MDKKVFIYKENNTDDRDCVKYIELRGNKLECGHYFPCTNVVGACFSQSLKVEELDFDNITSVLTKEDFILLDKYINEIHNLGYGITEGDERYLKGIQLYNDMLKPIHDKLLSLDNANLFEQVQAEEREYLKEEHSLTDEEVNYIFDNYYLDYRDRAIVGSVFDDILECAEEEAESMDYVTDTNRRWFSYEKFGQDLLEDENYLELNSGRIVHYEA